MDSRQAEAVTSCIVISALATGIIAVVIGIATHDLRSALIVGLCLLALAAMVSLYAAVEEWSMLGMYGLVAGICAIGLSVLQLSRNEVGSW